MAVRLVVAGVTVKTIPQKELVDKLNLQCELSCVIDTGSVNIVLPSVAGQPANAANVISHTDGVLFVIGRTRQHGNPLHCGRHARSWLGQGTCCPETKSARARTLQKELNSASPLRRTSVV